MGSAMESAVAKGRLSSRPHGGRRTAAGEGSPVPAQYFTGRYGTRCSFFGHDSMRQDLDNRAESRSYGSLRPGAAEFIRLATDHVPSDSALERIVEQYS